MPYGKKRTYQDAFPYLASSLMSSRKRKRKVSSRARTVRRGRIQSRGVQRSGVTRQHDTRTQYSRRRAPMRLRRRMKRSYQMFRSKLMKFVGTRTWIKNDRITSSRGIGQQIFDTVVLYGCGPSATLGSIGRGYNDVRNIIDSDWMINNGAGDAQARLSGGDVKVFFDTGVMDITIQNVSILDSTTSGIELDLYEFICNGKFERALAADGGGGFTIHDFYNNRAGDQILSGTVTQIDPFDRGVTPFEMGIQNKEMGLKITRKTKYFIPYGDTCTYQIRDSLNHGITTRKIINDQPVCMPFSKGLIIIAKVLPQYSEAIAPNIVIGCTRKYKYKIFAGHGNRGGIGI